MLNRFNTLGFCFVLLLSGKPVLIPVFAGTGFSGSTLDMQPQKNRPAEADRFLPSSVPNSLETNLALPPEFIGSR